MTLVRVTLEAHGVQLLPLRPEHAGELWAAIGADPEVWRYLPGRFECEADLAAFIAQADAAHAAGTDLPFLIRDARSGAALGSTRLMAYQPEHRAVEIGWTFLAPRAWCSTVNPACKRLLFGHAFDVLKVVRVQLKTDARNLHSQRAIAKLGAQREGVLRKAVRLPDGFQRDSVYYSVLDDEWPDVRAGLERRLP